MKASMLFIVVAACLGLALPAAAQPRGQGPGGPGNGPRSAGGHGPGGPGGPRTHDRPGGFGRLLQNPAVVKELGLSDSQVESLRNVQYEARKRQIKLQAKVADGRLEVQHQLGGDNPDEGAIMEAIERAGEAQIKMRKATIRQMLEGREILGDEKWKQMKQMMHKRMRPHSARRREGRREGMREGRDHRRRSGRESGPRSQPRGPRSDGGDDRPAEDMPGGGFFEDL